MKCSSCGALHDVAGKKPGVKIKCGKCGTVLAVPGDTMVGRTIGGYRILKKVGQGGMGAVYLAEQIRLRRKVAFKALSGGRSQDKAALANFHREAISAAQLSHANIVQVYDISMADGVPFITMEYVQGKTLQEVLDEKKKLPPTETARIAAQVLEALGRAHRAGIVHKDVKPGNVMLDAEGHAKVMDFGLARMMEASPGEGAAKRYGTVLYMAPEQAKTADVDHRADLYALGATMFQMLTGRPPFRGGKPRETLRLVATAPVPDPCELDPAIPRPLADLVVRMLAKAPDGRPGDAWEVLEALRATGLLEEGGVGGWLGSRRARAGALAGAAVAAAALLAVVLMFALGAGPFAQRPAAAPNGGEAPRDPEEDMRIAQLRDMLGFASEYEENNPENYRQIIELYADVANIGGDTRFGLEAKTRIAAVEKRRREAAEEHFANLRAEATELARNLQYAEALDKLHRWPDAYRGIGFEPRLASLREDIDATLKVEVERLVSDARDAMENDDFERAEALAQRLDGTGLPGLRDTARQLNQQIRMRRRRVEEAWAVQARQRHRQLLANLLANTRDREYDKATSLLDEALADRTLQTIYAPLRREKANVRTAQSVQEAAFEALQSGKAEGVRIRGVMRRFKRIEDGRLVSELIPGGPEDSIPIQQLPTSEVVRLAVIGMAPMDGEKHFRIGVFCLYEAAFDEAGDAFAQAANAGFEVPAYLTRRTETKNIAGDLGWQW